MDGSARAVDAVPEVKGNDLDQFKRAGTQAIVYPKDFASGKLQFPYSEGRRPAGSGAAP